jgi:hypothetical protein
MQEQLPRLAVACAIAALSSALSAQLSWTERQAIAPGARVDAALAYDEVRGDAVLFGGHDGSAGLADTWLWDGQEWQVATPASAPSARWQHAMVALPGGELLLFGGQDGVQPLADTWIWNGETWSRRHPAHAPPPRRGHALAYDAARSRAVLFGGIGPLGSLADTWEWDGSDWELRAPASAPAARAFHGMAFDATGGRNLTILFGGEQPNLTPLNDTWKWDGANWTRLTTSTTPAARSRAGLAYERNRARLVMFGGRSATAALGDTYEWTGTNWTRPSPNPAPPASSSHALCFHAGSGRILLFGGQPTSGPPTSTDTWAWSGTAWTKFSTATPSAREWAAMAFDPQHQRSVLFGGRTTVALGDTWGWDGIRWWPMATTGPAARRATAMVHDPDRARVLLFGGAATSSGTLYNDTWEWDGAAWRRITTSPTPTAVWQHSLAYDSVRGRTVLFGGVTSTGVPGGHWELSGTAWTQLQPVHRPPGSGPMCFDAARGRTVLAFVATDAVEIWEWDGIDWEQATPTVRPPRLFEPSLVYDAARARSVLIGSGDPDTETWEWDGIDWQRKTTPQRMPARILQASAYDSVRRRVVVFGGSNFLADTWEYGSGSFSTYETYGAGCLGSRGVPVLASTPGSLPAIGDVFRVDVTVLPLVGTPCSMFLGVSRTSLGGLPLPLDLGLVGMPGCLLLQSADLSFPLANLAGQARWSTAIPQQAALLGASFYNQALVLDRNANPIGFIVSNAAEGRIGS